MSQRDAGHSQQGRVNNPKHGQEGQRQGNQGTYNQSPDNPNQPRQQGASDKAGNKRDESGSTAKSK